MEMLYESLNLYSDIFGILEHPENGNQDEMNSDSTHDFLLILLLH